TFRPRATRWFACVTATSRSPPNRCILPASRPARRYSMKRRRLRRPLRYLREPGPMNETKQNGRRIEPKTPPPAARAAHASLGYRPLYRQVKELLIKRLGDGSWAPGQLLPSEPEIAAGLGVSPGTVRKALDEMSSESLLVRRQGRGTFVASHDE